MHGEHMTNIEQNKKRAMLHSYEQQLQAARKMARYTVRKRLAAGLDPDDPNPGEKRHAFTSQISQELFDSLMFYPNASPVVEDIREELAQALNRKVEFTYPPGDTLRIAVREENGLRRLNENEQAAARAALKRITHTKVGNTLFESRMGINTKA